MSPVQCYAVCTPDTADSINGTGMQTGQDSMTNDVMNDCCSGASTTQGYTTGSFSLLPSTPCILCKLQNIYHTQKTCRYIA